ncbi:MAG: NAD(P)-dependent oxidoreductase, partial [Pseudomonadota bacterium]
MTKVAFIGLGTMGRPMAERLRGAGFDVVGMDVDAGMRAAFDGAIAPAAAPLAEADVILTMLPEGRHVSEVYAEAILPGASAGTLLIDCSTIDVETTRTLAAQARAAGLAMLDAPVSGGPAGAESGGLSFMVGGGQAAFERAQPMFAAMGAKITHFGASGSGQAAKAC